MKKLLIIVITLFLFTNILHSEKKLKGKVKEYTEYIYDIKYKFGEPQKILNYKYKYDSKGDKIEKAKYNSDGSLDYKLEYKYKYDSKGNKIKYEVYRVETKFGEKQLILNKVTEYKYTYYK